MRWTGYAWVRSLSLVSEVGQSNQVGQFIWSARWSGRPSSACCKAVWAGSGHPKCPSSTCCKAVLGVGIELLDTNLSTSGEVRSERYLSQTVTVGPKRTIMGRSWVDRGSMAEAGPLK